MNNGNNNPTPPTVEEILAENRRRLQIIHSPYDPIAGDPSDPERVELDIPGLSDRKLFIPRAMAQTDMVAALLRAGSLDRYILAEKHVNPSDSMKEMHLKSVNNGIINRLHFYNLLKCPTFARKNFYRG